MHDSCDDSGNEYLMMDSMVDYQKSYQYISVSNQRVVHRGWIFMWQYTAGWQQCVQWIDGSTSWHALKYLEESYRVEIAEYAVAQEIDHETEFNRWVKAVLKNRLRIYLKEKERSIT